MSNIVMEQMENEAQLGLQTIRQAESLILQELTKLAQTNPLLVRTLYGVDTETVNIIKDITPAEIMGFTFCDVKNPLLNFRAAGLDLKNTLLAFSDSNILDMKIAE